LQLAGQALSTEIIPIKVQLVAPPLYVMTTACLDKAAGEWAGGQAGG
jgi:translation initiation factor 2 alpha subunit (eIF-2alpha)